MMRLLCMTLLLAGCGHSVMQQTDAAPVDMTEAADMTTGSDMMQGGDMAAADLLAVDLTPASDMAECLPYPVCATAATCCNGALNCVSYQCVNVSGQYCNTYDVHEPGPLIYCGYGAQCGTDHKCQ